MAARGGTGVVVDLSHRRLERLHLHSTAGNKLAGSAHAMPVQSRYPRMASSFAEEVEVTPALDTTRLPVISPSGVRCLILKNNCLTFLPSALFVPDDDDEDDYRLDRLYNSSELRAADPRESADGGRPSSVLRILDAASNRLTRLPSSIGYAKSLTVLNLTANRIASLPPEIGRLVSLRDLYLGGNELTCLPDEIGACCSLQRLHLNSNPLQTLPYGLGRLHRDLIELELTMTHSTLAFPPAAIVRKGTRAILTFLLQAGEERRIEEKRARKKAVLASTAKRSNEIEAWNKEKEKMRQQLNVMERRMRMLEVQNKRLELDKNHLQKKLVELVLEKRQLQHETHQLEERASKGEIRRQCVVCMDHPRTQVLLPCRYVLPPGNTDPASPLI